MRAISCGVSHRYGGPWSKQTLLLLSRSNYDRIAAASSALTEHIHHHLTQLFSRSSRDQRARRWRHRSTVYDVIKDGAVFQNFRTIVEVPDFRVTLEEGKFGDSPEIF